MHRKLLNEATLHLTIAAKGPLLVKSGLESWEPTRPDMEFIRTWDARVGRETVFIPGSSLKGMLRSYSEKIAHTLNVYCCDPFENTNPETRSCGRRGEDLAKQSKTDALYAQACAACKIYGSANLAGRAAFADAYPTQDVEEKLTKRTAVAIDRVLGSVAVGPFDFEALVGGEFHTQIRLRNFELWQLGLLGLAARDLCLGRIRIGYGKSRGFGTVTARLDALELRAIAPGGLELNDGQLRVQGIGGLLTPDELKNYDIAQTRPAAVATTATLKDEKDELIGKSISLTRQSDIDNWSSPEVEALFGLCVQDAWGDYRRSHQAGGTR